MIFQFQCRNLSDFSATNFPAMNSLAQRILVILIPVLLMAFSGSAQTGPMGIGNGSGDPTFPGGSQPRLLLWLDGSSAVTGGNGYENNHSLTQWLDKSGNEHHFFLGEGTWDPTLYTTGAPSGPRGSWNGAPFRPSVNFRGTSEHPGKPLVCESFDMPDDGMSIFFVIKTEDHHFGLFNYATVNSDRELLIYNDDGFRIQMKSSIDRGSFIDDISNITWQTGGITWSNQDDDNWQYLKNIEDEVGFDNFNNITITPGGKVIIGDISGGPSSYPSSENFAFDKADGTTAMNIAEIIVFEGRVSRPVTRLMRTYFWVKYGISGAGTGWDKFHGLMATGSGNKWGGRYYAPIGIGNDIKPPNAGSLNEARSHGLVLRVRENEWTQTRSYLVAGLYGETPKTIPENSPVSDDLPEGVQERWTRLWEICGNSEGNEQNYEIAFDFGEGIDGQIPQNPENFVLLYRTNPESGEFTVLNSVIEKFVNDDEIVFRVPKSALIAHNRFYTVGTTDVWASSLTGDIKRTWYAYKSGDWTDPLTWTIDGSAAPAYVNPDNAIPGSFDNIHIGAGKSVKVNTDLAITSYDKLIVRGTLDLGSTTRLSFLNISGSGLIKSSANNFPLGNTGAFANPDLGGTYEIYGSGGFVLNNHIELNKLVLNLGSSTNEITLAENLTHHGLFEIKRGTLVINNSQNITRNIYSYGDVLVESAGRIRVVDAPPNTRHNWYFHGDFLNNGGQVRFTNRTPQTNNFEYYNSFEQNDFVVAHFVSGSKNQVFRANGLTYFNRIVIDKGVDMTYVLSISSNNSDNFHLLGPCNYMMSEVEFSPEYYSPGNNGNRNSFALINGTAEIKENIFIPLHLNGHGNYNLNHSAQLWVNGGEVTKGKLGGTGTSTAFVIYGTVKVSSGKLNVFCNAGMVIRGNGVIQVDGGEVETNQIQTSTLGPTNIGGLIINDGLVDINGQRPEGSRQTYATLSLTYPGNIFRMAGGELRVTGPTDRGLVFINSAPQNTSVTGGKVFLDVSTTKDRYYIVSRAAFWDLTLNRSDVSGSNRAFKVINGTSAPSDSNNAVIPQQDLVVMNKLSIIGNNTTLQMGASAGASDLYVHGDFQIGSGCTYIHNNNTTYFKGTTNTSMTFGGSTAFPFYHVVIDKTFDSGNVNIVNSGPATAMTILGNLRLEKGEFLNRGRDVELMGNLFNRSRFGNELGDGQLRFIGESGRQECYSDGGIIHRMRIDNTDGVVLINDDLTITNDLSLDGGAFYIGEHKLRFESTSNPPISGVNEGSGRFIVCSGNASAGGIELLNHAANQTLTFPFGVSTGSELKYTQAIININSGWEDEGYIRVTPVDTLLTTADLSGSENYLNFYWRVSSSDYETKPNVTHRFKYVNDDIRGDIGTFKPARVLSTMPFTRSVDISPDESHINTSNRIIYFNGNDRSQQIDGNGTPLVDADYSAGSLDRFPQETSPEVYFSRNGAVDASWNVAGNWNKLSDCVDCSGPFDYHDTEQLASDSYPGIGDIAVIGFDVNTGKPHRYKAPNQSFEIEAAQILFTPLQDAEGNRLERYQSSTPSELTLLRPSLAISSTANILKVGQISGEGGLLLTNDIDLGVTDVGGFMAEDSSIVIVKYSSALVTHANFLPSTVPNLFLASNITFSNNLRVRGNLEISANSKLLMSEADNGNIEVDGNLILNRYTATSGTPSLLFNRRGNFKSVHVKGDVKLGGHSAFISVSSSGDEPLPPSPWTPDEIGALLWLDASEGVITDGDKVITWQDQSSNGYHASQSDSDKRPTVQIGINGQQTLHFDGVDDFLSIPHNSTFNIASNQDFEIFVVSQFNNPATTVTSECPVVYGKGEINTGDFILYTYDNKFRVYMDKGKMGVIAPNNQGTTPNMGWLRRQGNNGYIYNTTGGNQSKSGVSNANMNANTHPVTIGAAENGTTRFLEGQIAEIILVKRTLTHEDRQKLEGYLAHKWGLEDELPDGHPYKTEAPIKGQTDLSSAQLIVEGDIIQNLSNNNQSGNGIQLYHVGTDTTYVDLILSGSGSKEFDKQSGPKPRFWKITLDKGSNTNSGFAFNSDIDVIGPSDQMDKPIQIRNGLMKFNHSGIDISLASGGGDFLIPSTGGLELNDGELSISGYETGMVLAGSLKITGGKLTLGDTEGINNYLEYAAGSSPKIEISGGELTVGSQIRRGLSSTLGSLDYRQSGGTVIIGKYAAPEVNRGMLEVLNDNSRFEHTGGTITFVRGISAGSTASLRLTPTNYEVSGDAQIIVGTPDSPSGAQIQNFGIQCNIPLNDLKLRTYNSPTIHLISNNLELKGDLVMDAGSIFNSGDHDVIIHGDFHNDGVFISTNGLLKVVHSVPGSITGSGMFDLYNFEKSGESETSVGTNLLVKNDFDCFGGEMDFGNNSISVKGNVIVDGNIKFNPGSIGLAFTGVENQVFKRTGSGTSEIDIMTISNHNGVSVPPGSYHFIINKELRMDRGVFLLSGNLLEMGLGAAFTDVSPFGEKNMIVTGATFANYGLLMHIPANTTDDIFVPVGIERYMPINLDFSQEGYTSGNSDCSLLMRLNEPEIGIIVDDEEDPGPEINDFNNVLQMFVSIEATNVDDDFRMDLKIRYHDQYMKVTSPYTEEDYIAAKVYPDNTTVSKLGPEPVDHVNNIITFNLSNDIDGDYLAGIDDAIPANIKEYETNIDFLDDNIIPVQFHLGYSPPTPGGAPSGSIVTVKSGHTLLFSDTRVNFYRTIIEEGARILIPATSLHRLGRVSGKGTIELQNTGILPAGDYTHFFVCEGGKLEFNASVGNSYEILSNLPPIKEITLSGGGELIIANSDLNVCTDLVINSVTSGTGLRVRASNSSLLHISGNLLVNGGEFDLRQGDAVVEGGIIISGTGTTSGLVTSDNTGSLIVEGDLEIGGRGMNLGTVFRETHVHGNVSKTTDPTTGSIKGGTDGAKLVFNGPVQQTITGDFTGVHDIPTIEIDNSHGLVIDGNVDITEKLILTDGKVFTEPNNLIKLTNQNVEIERPSSAYSTAFINGPMQWTLGGSSNPQGDRTFPVGKNERYRPLTVANRSTQRTWEVEYNDTIARVEPEVNNEMLPSNPVIETVSIQEYWRVETTNTTGSTNAKIGLSWGDHSAVSTNTADQSKLVVLAYNTETDYWDSYGGTDFNYNAPVNHGSLKSESNISFGQKRFLTLGSTDRVNPLPVGWLYFKGENRGPDHLLTWATATETNNDYFELERSIDGRSWEFVTRVTGAGHSTSERRYSYTDYGAPFGTVYYRLRQVDFNGSSNFAPHIVSLYKELPEGTFDMVLYPNPTRLGRFNFRMSQIADAVVEVSISDLSGARLMHKYVQVDGAGVSSPVDIQLKPGIYLVSVIADAKLISKPLVVTE